MLFQSLVAFAALALAAVGAYVLVATYLHVCRSRAERFGGGGPAVVLVHSQGCPHCVRYLPTFDAVAGEKAGSGVRFVKVERDDPGAKALSEHVSGYPTTLALDGGGRVVGALVGNRSRQELLEFVAKHQ